jgi:GPH family glycoside/pentoside/hexuronide:cation symporter
MVAATGLSVLFYYAGSEHIVMMMALQVLISMCAGSIFPLLWSMYADIADYSELKTGRRATGLIFSSSSMSQKLGWAFGTALSGWLLGYYGFQANMAQGEGAIHGIRMLLSWLPAVGTALSVLLIAFYPLNEKKVRAICAELEKHRTVKNK